MAQTRIVAGIRHIRGHDWHFMVNTVDGVSPALEGWVVADGGAGSTKQLAFMAVAAAASAGKDNLRITFERHEVRGDGSSWFLGTTEVTLVTSD